MISTHTANPKSNGRAHIWLESEVTPNPMHVPMNSFCLVIDSNTHPPNACPSLELVFQRPEPALSSACAGPEGIIPTQSFIRILEYSIVATHALYFSNQSSSEAELVTVQDEPARHSHLE